ncbi:MAG: VanZ family protein [Clostridia bacterium]
MNKYIIVLRVLLVAMICFIWGNSLIPAQQSSEISTYVQEVITEILEEFIEFDTSNSSVSTFSIRKLAHFCEFMTLGGLLLLNFFPKNRQNLINIIFVGFSVAFLDETIQMFIKGRGSEIKDVWIDFSGLICGIILMYLFVIIVYKVKEKVQYKKKFV